jgi:S-adenosylhomocysteine hydrolase
VPPIRNIPVAKVQASRAAPVRLRLDQLLERMSTPQGMLLSDQLLSRIAPNLKDEGMLEPVEPLRSPPKDKLGLAMVGSLQRQFARAGDARQEMPHTVADILLPFSKNGVLDLDAAERGLGKGLGDWVRKLAAIPADTPKVATSDRLTYNALRPDQLQQILAHAPTVAPRLEALDFTLSTFAKPDELKGFQFLGLQHLFASTEQLFDALGSLGVSPQDSRVIGKIYSTNFRVAGELEAKGMVVDARSRSIGSKPFDQAMGESILNQLQSVIAKLPQPVRTVHDGAGMHYEWDTPPKPMALIIDDGAEAIKMLHEKFPQYAPFFACVEQTRRGARIAHELADKGELKCAVVNVAESWAKLERESPMIGESVVREVQRKLERFEQVGVPKPKEATVIGYGAIGQRVAAALQARGLTVHVFDSDPSRLKDLPKGLVAHTDKGEALEHGQVTISCVGARTLFEQDYEKLPDGAMLVNAASADDELGPQDLLKWQKDNLAVDSHGDTWGVFEGKPIDLGQGDDPAHSDTVVQLYSGKELLVASNGFVVNMTGERDPIPPQYIQLTRSLLLMGALTAARADKPGLIDVPEAWQKQLVAHIERQLATTGGSLQKPLWDAVTDPPPSEPPAIALDLVREEREHLAATKAGIERALQRGPIETITLGRVDENVGDVTGPSPIPAGTPKVHGYALGRATDRASFAFEVANAMAVPDKEMTVEAWALYHATRFENGALGWHLNVKFNPNEPGRPTVDQLLAGPANQARAKAAPEETAFAAYFGYHARGLAMWALKSRLKRDATPAELADAMIRAAAQGKVDLAPYVDYLRTQSADDVALADALAAARPA